MPEKVMKCGIKKRKDYFYFVDKQGDVSMRKLKGGSDIKVHKCGIKKQTGFFYYIDEHGDVSCIEIEKLKEYPAIEKTFNILSKLDNSPHYNQGVQLKDKNKPMPIIKLSFIIALIISLFFALHSGVSVFLSVLIFLWVVIGLFIGFNRWVHYEPTKEERLKDARYYRNYERKEIEKNEKERIRIDKIRKEGTVLKVPPHKKD